MLTQLTINNFAIVDSLEIDFQSGLTTITGETGAGKSIAIDALGLCLGNRADASMVRHGTNRADICCRFLLANLPKAYQWLENNQLDNEQECLLRRVINQDGRSKAFINGSAVPLSQLRELGQLLIQIHGQHAHQLILKSEHQLALLDAFMNDKVLLQQMKQSWLNWHDTNIKLVQFEQQHTERQARYQLLQYQLKELNEFKPQLGEYEQIEEEYKRLSNSGQIINLSQQAIALLTENDEQNISSFLHQAKQAINELVTFAPNLSNLLSMLEEAQIQVNEASDELRHYAEQMECEPGRLYELEQRMSQQYALARKHQIRPEELPLFHQKLNEEYEQINLQDEEQQLLIEQVKKYHQQALDIAEKLHNARSIHAQELAEQLTASMHQLSMGKGLFAINVQWQPEQLSIHGASKIEFLVTANPGQPLQPLYKVASGGELSRIALAIQLITAEKTDNPVLIFDEIDTGISGATAATVGKLLRQLGESTQIMCVTHLPQVASCGHHHFFVSKSIDSNNTKTQMILLDKEARIQEIARLLGGKEISKRALANAKELLTT